MLETNKIHKGDWIELANQLDDESINMIMTSPPYWGLRDYGVEGQLGLEPHPNLFIKHLIDGFRILRSKLKKTGSLYLNLGDTYFGSGAGTQYEPDISKSKEIYVLPYGKNVSRKCIGKQLKSGLTKNIERYCCNCGKKFMASPGQYFCDGACAGVDNTPQRIKGDGWLQSKQLMLMPSRVAIAMQEDGWILRNDIIWHKPNPMPSSVKDRLNTTYEHIFHFVKSRKYFYDLDAIREPHTVCGVTDNRPMGILRQRLYPNSKYNKDEGSPFNKEWNKSKENIYGNDDKSDRRSRVLAFMNTKDPNYQNPLGKNPGDVLKQDNVPGRNVNMYEGFNKRYVPREDGKNPGDVYKGKFTEGERAGFQREQTLKEKRIHQIIQPKIAEYIKQYLTKEKKEQLNNIFGEHKWTHWIRTDESGASLPSPEDWFKLKEVLGFNNEYDDLMTETEVYLDDGLMWRNKGKNPGDFMSITTQPFPEAHFAVYPEKICIKPIKSSCPEGGIVLDPFAGAGTTCLVALKLMRKFIGFELNEKYIDIANKRLKPYINQQNLLEF